MNKIFMVYGPGVVFGPGIPAPAKLLADAAGLTFVSSGHLFRGHVEQKTPMGLRMGRYINAGDLVPDEVMVEAVADALATSVGGWVLSGFPSTVGQAKSLAQRGHQPDVVFELVLTEDEYDVVMRRRIELHPQLAGQVEVMWFRYSTYPKNTAPLRDYYQARGLLSTVSGFGDDQDIAARLIAIVTGG